MPQRKSIPVVDLFAGAGGLGEGFSSIRDGFGNRVFNVRVSIEKDQKAVETLELRTLFRTFPPGEAPECYYNYLRGNISKSDLISQVSIREAWKEAQRAVHQATLGETPCELIDQWIMSAIGNEDIWVLIGSPPCQAYSMVGRARMRSGNPDAFENDDRHFLYREYLRIIRKFRPTVFVMENVKGILSSMHGGTRIFDRIIADLSHPTKGLKYEIRSFVRHENQPKPVDFIVEAENHGLPQKRHRVILFGVRSDLVRKQHRLLVQRIEAPNVRDILGGMPKVRSRLSLKSRLPDSLENWLAVLGDTRKVLASWPDSLGIEMGKRIDQTMADARYVDATGARFMEYPTSMDSSMPLHLKSHITDTRLGGVCQHESRSHMPSDLHRYLFASCYSDICGISPKLSKYPLVLYPDHKNMNAMEVPFPDRFRVQPWELPSTTIMSHMAKDGHYFIHPDPSQCPAV